MTATTFRRLHTPQQGPEANTPEWAALRYYDPDRAIPVIVGASEAAAACNQSPYNTPLDLYLEKRFHIGREFKEPQEQKMDLGRRLEPVILEFYADRNGCEIEPDQPLFHHPAAPWVAATPDALAWQLEDDPTEWCVDAKSTGFRMLDRTGEDEHKYGADGTDQIPLVYFLQAQQQMAVMGLARCDFPVLVDARRMNVYTVHRDDELISAIMSAETELVERIRDANPPEPNWTHPASAKAIQRMFPDLVAGEIVQLTEIEHDMFIRLGAIKDQLKTLETQKMDLTNRLMFAMGNAAVARFPDADFELARHVVKPSYVVPNDVLEIQSRLGSIKTAGYVKLTNRKIRPPATPKTRKVKTDE